MILELSNKEILQKTITLLPTGDQPLMITNAKGSCGCTVPEWPKEPIMPGETGVIKVEFNSKGKKGVQSKRVTITANTEPVQTFLTIKGEILVPDQEETDETMAKENPLDKDWKSPAAKDCFAIFPNPTSDVLKLELNEHLGESVDINILNSTGGVVNSRKVPEITGLIEFQVMDYAAGTYYVNIKIGEKAPATKCFVIAKE